MYSSREEQSPPAEAPAPGPAERKSTTNGDDARPAGLLHEPHELSTSTLTKLEEFKPMGPVQMSDMSRNAEQKFLVRRPGANWEDLTVKLRLMEGDGSQPWVKRWVITSLYKHHGPENIA